MQIEAEIQDSTHLKLHRALEGEVGSIVVVKILDRSEHDEFQTGAAALLERAYADDEPDYSEAGTPISQL